MRFLLVSIIMSASLLAFAAEPKTLTVYTSRKTHLIEPLLEIYTQKTGVKIKHVNGKAGSLIQKIKQEGAQTPADLLITVDAGNLWNAAEMDLLLPLSSASLEKRVPTRLRDPKGRWFGLSLRARTIFYNKEKVKPSELESYKGLADKKWQGRLCLRTSRKVYNQSLTSAMIKRLGEKKTEAVIKGWVKNLGKPVFTSDTQLLEAIDKGTCQVGVANTYYLARMLKKKQGQNVGVFWPGKDFGGVHVNISGAGVVKASKNRKQAQAFLEWLSTDEAQKLFASLNDEYPVVSDVPLSKTLKKWGAFSQDETPLAEIGRNQKKAIGLMDRAKYR